MIQHPAKSPLVSLDSASDHAAQAIVERQIERQLPSGRSLVLRTDPAGEELEIRSRRGEVEVRIVLTDAGPVVTLRGGRLEMESPAVSFRCDSFAVEARSAVNLTSQGEVHIAAQELHARTEKDIHLNGAFIRLNCTPDAPAPLPAATPLPTAATCCDHAVASAEAAE